MYCYFKAQCSTMTPMILHLEKIIDMMHQIFSFFFPDISPELVRKYLAEHPLFLESIVKEQTPKKNLLRVQGDSLGRKKSRTLGGINLPFYIHCLMLVTT